MSIYLIIYDGTIALCPIPITEDQHVDIELVSSVIARLSLRTVNFAC